jgi:hypothetical protein
LSSEPQIIIIRLNSKSSIEFVFRYVKDKTGIFDVFFKKKCWRKEHKKGEKNVILKTIKINKLTLDYIKPAKSIAIVYESNEVRERKH